VPNHPPGADAQASKVASSAGADYYRVRDGERQVTIRVSVLFNVPPLCLTCVRFDCRHVDTFNAQRAAA
jgi:hypothetical protein